MKILSDSAIEKMRKKGSIKITPEPEDGQLQPNSVDLTLGRMLDLTGSIFYPPHMDKDPEPIYSEVEPVCDRYLLKKGEMYFFETEQTIKADNSITMIHISPRSTLARAFVESIPLSGDTYYWLRPPHEGKILCSIKSNFHDIYLKPGQRVVQAIFFTGKENLGKMRQLHAERFMKPNKQSQPLDLSHGMKDDELFIEADTIKGTMPLNEDTCVRAITKEKVDYSDGKHASIMMYNSGEVMDMCLGIPFYSGTGIAPLADAGYQGNLSGFFFGSAFPRFTAIGFPVLYACEFEIEGEVSRLYGSKTLGSHYQGGNKT